LDSFLVVCEPVGGAIRKFLLSELARAYS